MTGSSSEYQAERDWMCQIIFQILSEGRISTIWKVIRKIWSNLEMLAEIRRSFAHHDHLWRWKKSVNEDAICVVEWCELLCRSGKCIVGFAMVMLGIFFKFLHYKSSWCVRRGPIFFCSVLG